MNHSLRFTRCFALAAACGAVSLGSVSLCSAESGSKPAAPAGSGAREGAAASGPIGVGAQAPAAQVQSLAGEPIDLAASFESGRTVLVVQRGYPGYQCPICSRIMNGFMKQADDFAKMEIEVVFVYPGASAGLDGQAQEFLGGKSLPSPMSMVLDPDFAMVNAYGLRWDAPNETAYPSTYIVAEGGQIEWAKVSQTHGGRASATEVLAALKELDRN